MADYREVKGLTIQTKETDPVVNTGPGGAWASAPSLNTARWITTGCAYGYTGSETLALCVGGRKPPGATYSNNNEEFNGTSWSEKAEISNARDQLAGNGTTTSGLVSGGYDGAVRNYSESWNGVSWTDTPTMGTARYELGSAGATNTAAIRFSGAPSKDETETWNGSAWSEQAEVNTTMTAPAGAGTSTAALKISGENPSAPKNRDVEEWNGASWTEIAEVNTGRRYGVGAGDVNTALFYGGGPSLTAKTESWNGSSWTEVNDLGTAIQYSGGGGNSGSTAAINYGGQDPSVVGTTETFSVTPVTAKTLEEGQIFLSGGTTLKGFGKIAGAPTTAWASGGTLNEARPGGNMNGVAGASVSASLIYGGSPFRANNEFYNGSTWSEQADLTTGVQGHAGGGTQTSAISFGGQKAPGNTDETETWNGASWTEVNELNTGRRFLGGTANNKDNALAFGGYTTTNVNSVESWNGTSWTEVSEINNTRTYMAGVGTNTDALGFGGEPTPRAYTEKWNGSTWTETGDLNSGRSQGAPMGKDTSSALFAGGEPGDGDETEIWNGTTWSELNDLATPRSGQGGGGTAVSGVCVAGGPPSPKAQLTEEWEATAALVDVTVS